MDSDRHIMEKLLAEENFSPEFDFRGILKSDLSALGELLFEADLGTADDEGFPVENSVEEINNTFTGKYGEFLEGSSFVALVDQVIVAAVLFTYYPKESMPLVAFTMTHPKFKNRGLCKGLLRIAFKNLKNAGYQKCFLAVNSANLPAVAAYSNVGFQIRN